MTDLEDYLRFVYPWDGEDVGSLKMIGELFTGRDGKPAWFNHGQKSFEEYRDLIRRQVASGKQVYTALATYRETNNGERTYVGSYKAKRSRANVEKMKCVVLDVDVKANAYPDVFSAVKAVRDFAQRSNLPDPSMVISSGGGLHIYWCFTEAVPAAHRWFPLAQALVNAARTAGLIFDTQCTTDYARVLRPPESFNHKFSPHRPVTLLFKSQLYDIATLEQALHTFMGPRLVASGGSVVAPVAVGGLNQALSQGVQTAPPIDMFALADAGCGVFADAIDNHGAGHSEPLWSSLLMMATFDIDPRNTAHDISDGYAGYDPAATDAKLDAKLQARAQNPGLGWVTCKTFSALHGACQTCPFRHFINEGKSPAHIPAPLQQPKAPDLPSGYFRHPDRPGLVMHMRPMGTGKKRYEEFKPVCAYPLRDGFVDTSDGALVFTATVENVDRYVRLPNVSSVTARDAMSALASYRMVINPDDHNWTQRFLVAWTHHLQQINAARIKPLSLGWNDGEEFTYNDQTYGKTGAKRAFVSQHDLNAPFKPKGELKVWREAMTILNDMKNPALDCVGAAAFAGPLVAFTGEQSLLLSAIGETGGGKTTAAKISQATWGHPINAMSGVNDTEISTINRISHAPNMPFIWDELKTQRNFDRFTETVFNLTQGRDRYRMTSDIKIRNPGRINTLMVCCANDSVADQLTRATKSNAAGAIRCFEIHVAKTPSTMEPNAIARKVAELNVNYGLAGEVYAKHIGEHHDRLKKEVGDYITAVRKTLGGDRDERFWHAIIAVLLLGATEANKLGLANFDIAMMWAFLAKSMQNVRLQRGGNLMDLDTAEGCEELIGTLVSSTMGTSLLLTDKIHDASAGRPNPGSVVLLETNPRLQDPWIQYAGQTGKMRIVATKFNDWLKAHQISERAARDGLVKFMKADMSVRGSIGAGTKLFGGLAARLRCIDLVLPDHLRASLPVHAPSPGSSTPTGSPGST